MTTFVRPKKITARARLKQPNYANFLKYYHDGSAKDDPFYKYITKLADSHKLLATEDQTFKKNFDEEGFYFKIKDYVKCKNSSGRPCLLEDLLDHDVSISLKITPYNFTTDDGKHLIGLSLQATHVNAIRN